MPEQGEPQRLFEPDCPLVPDRKRPQVAPALSVSSSRESWSGSANKAERQKDRQDHRIHDVDEECTDDRHDNEGLRRRAKALPDYAASSAAQRMVHIMNIMGLGRAAMARNAVQFQKGLSEAAFEDLYGTEAKCRELVMRWRWPNGFECPVCGGTSYSEVKTRGLFQCSACRRQTSLIAGTIFAATKVALRVWFRAMYHLTQSKQGISSIELGRRLGVTQTTAWTIKHKLAQVMMERDAEQQRPRRTR